MYAFSTSKTGLFLGIKYVFQEVIEGLCIETGF